MIKITKNLHNQFYYVNRENSYIKPYLDSYTKNNEFIQFNESIYDTKNKTSITLHGCRTVIKII